LYLPKGVVGLWNQIKEKRAAQRVAQSEGDDTVTELADGGKA